LAAPLDTLQAELRARLAAFTPRLLPLEGRRPAGVAVAVCLDERGEPAVVLTRRRADLRRHAGQWALPGGHLDAGETPEDAALRELAEEVGLPRPGHDAARRHALLGRLDDFCSRSGFVISPVVVWAVGGGPLRPEPAEVEAVHLLTLDELAGEGLLNLDPLEGSTHPVLSLSVLGTRVFAPTGALLWQFREVALFGRDTRVSHYEQPPFAWR
jgi:8-oxo-dGTP pyrophosphatase MutT (NUDIX family)